VSFKHLSFPVICASLILCSLAPDLSAQQKKAPKIVLQDPELYYAFLRAHNDVDMKLQSSSAPAAAQISASTAVLYNINPADLPNLTAEVRKFNVNLGAWYLNVQQYLATQRAAKKPPDIKTLVNYQRQRQRLVMTAHGGIHAALTPASWTGLYGYINGSFKSSLGHAAGGGK